MEISAIRLKRKGFNAQWKETKAMKVHGLKKQRNNKTSQYISQLHNIGKRNKCVECCFCFWCAAGVDPDSEFTIRTLKKIYIISISAIWFHWEKPPCWYSADMLTMNKQQCSFLITCTSRVKTFSLLQHHTDFSLCYQPQRLASLRTGGCLRHVYCA